EQVNQAHELGRILLAADARARRRELHEWSLVHTRTILGGRRVIMANPEKIGPFPLIRMLGAGGMGRVYLAAHPDDGRKIAIKVLTDVQKGTLVKRFRREIDVLRGLSDPHVVGYVAADGDAIPPWLAMAYIEGPSLEQILKSCVEREAI